MAHRSDLKKGSYEVLIVKKLPYMFDHSYLLNEYIPATMDHNSNQIIKLLVINSIVRLQLTQLKSQRINYCEKRNKQINS